MESVLINETGGLGPVELALIESGGTVTPASRLVAQAIGTHRHLFDGTGIDWGVGTGLLAILLARIDSVDSVVALEKDPDAAINARHNVRQAGMADKVDVLDADSFAAVSTRGRQVLQQLRSSTDFLLANPPASVGDDGLGWRRSVLTGATEYLRPGAPILIQISAQYGAARIRQLATESGHTYLGLLESSDWSPFELDRDDLWQGLDDYTAEEQRGGHPYEFGTDGSVSAVEAMDRYRQTGEFPLTRWQVHHFAAGTAAGRP